LDTGEFKASLERLDTEIGYLKYNPVLSIPQMNGSHTWTVTLQKGILQLLYNNNPSQSFEYYQQRPHLLKNRQDPARLNYIDVDWNDLLSIFAYKWWSSNVHSGDSGRSVPHELSFQQLLDHFLEVQKGREIHSDIPFPTAKHLLVDTFEGAFTLAIDRIIDKNADNTFTTYNPTNIRITFEIFNTNAKWYRELAHILTDRFVSIWGKSDFVNGIQAHHILCLLHLD
jgi:hypothetical protein